MTRRRQLSTIPVLCLAGWLLAGPLTAEQTVLPLVQSTHMTYEGSFRFPGPSGPTGDNGDYNSFNGGGEALSWRAETGTIIAGGSRSAPTTMAELNIPEIRQSSAIAGYATATYRQPHTDVIQGRHAQIGCGGPVGGSLVWGARLILSAYCYYDAAYIQVRSHYATSLDFASSAGLVGPVRVESPAGSGGGSAGFVSGYMTPIPTEWQAALGGPALTGNCCIPIITRTSWGPAASVFNPADVGVRDPVPAKGLLYYPDGNRALDGGSGCDATSELFNCNTGIAGAIFPSGTGSILFFGSQGTGDGCYGRGVNDPKLHHAPDPESPGEELCYDPAAGSKGQHAYPYRQQVWAYRASDLVAVKNGKMQPWQVRPYAVWGFDVPFQHPRRSVNGVTYDPATRRVFVSAWVANDGDGYKPLMHVFRLDVGSTPK